MSGSKNGVASQISRIEKHALYMHCYGHALNLAVGQTVKQSKICCKALEVAFEITKLIKFSPKSNMPILIRLKQMLQRKIALVQAFEPFALLGGLCMGTQLALSLKILTF